MRCLLSRLTLKHRISFSTLRPLTSRGYRLEWQGRRVLLKDEEVRAVFRNVASVDEVEEVVEARRGIWGDRNGGKPDTWVSASSMSTESSKTDSETTSKQKPDKRSANMEAQSTKRRKLDDGEDAPLPVYATKFDEEELKAEERRPKRKVAVMLGYSGTGYKGMQLAPDQKTIEGDLFKAFVQAGAISKANADDPKKSSFVRCARTDKGVHAAGNIISLKLIIEDEKIVEKINEALAPQIRVWGFERTNNSFSAYQLCDSRIYEYLIPTHSFLPPHPSSWLARKCKEWAEKKDDVAQWEARQEEVKDYWEKVDEQMIQPILMEYDESVRRVLQRALYLTAERQANRQGKEDGVVTNSKEDEDYSELDDEEQADDAKAEAAEPEMNDNSSSAQVVVAQAGTIPEALQKDDFVERENNTSAERMELSEDAVQKTDGTAETTSKDQQEPSTMHPDRLSRMQPAARKAKTSSAPTAAPATKSVSKPASNITEEQREARRQRHKIIAEGVKRLRAAYVAAKRAYRIPDRRKQRLQDTLDLYLGTRNFHNYTVLKVFDDPSARRVIKSFQVNPQPILIDGTEWLSLKVHGQSFMMHQIRKMVGMAALIVRCGCDPSRIVQSYSAANMSIPKAPALGLLLERPVFDSYNKRARAEFDKEPIEFDKYESEMNRFKQEFIYERMYRDEEEQNVFGNFFNHVDNFPSETFLFVTSGGLEATGEDQQAVREEMEGKSARMNWKRKTGATGSARREIDVDSDDDDEGGVRQGDGLGEEG